MPKSNFQAPPSGHCVTTEREVDAVGAEPVASSAEKAITPDAVYKIVRAHSGALGFQISAHALRATAATNTLDHQTDIAKVHEGLAHANIATTRIYDHRKTLPEDSPTFKGVNEKQSSSIFLICVISVCPPRAPDSGVRRDGMVFASGAAL